MQQRAGFEINSVIRFDGSTQFNLPAPWHRFGGKESTNITKTSNGVLDAKTLLGFFMCPAMMCPGPARPRLYISFRISRENLTNHNTTRNMTAGGAGFIFF